MVDEQIRQILQTPGACVTCTSFEVIETVASEATRSFFVSASGTVFSIVSAFLTVFVIWKLTMALMGRPQDYSELMAVVLRAALVAGIVAHPEELFDAFYLVYGLGINFAGNALTADPGNGGLAGLLHQAEASFREGLGTKLADMLRETSFYRFGALLAILSLIIPLAVLAWEMVKYFFRPLFVSFGIGVMLPFLMAFIIFDRTTPIAVNALKLMAASAIQLVLAASVVSLMIGIVGAISDVVASEAAVELFSTLYFIVLATTVVLIFLFPVVMQLPEAALGVMTGGHGGAIRLPRFIPRMASSQT